MKNNGLGTKILMAVITLAVLAYFGVQAYFYFTDPLSTTMAYTYRVEEETQLAGFVVREERVLAQSGDGLLQLTRAEGQRVGAGGSVALVYADRSALDAQEEIAALNTRLAQVQYAQEAALGAEVSLKLDSQIISGILGYRESLAAGKLHDAEARGGDLRSLVLKRDYTYTAQADLSGEIADIQTRMKELKNRSAGTVRRINAPVSGLYSAVTDGYEAVLTPAALKDLTPSALNGLEPDKSAVSDVGRLILGDAWYYAAVMPVDEAKELAQQANLRLRFAKGVERDLAVTVHSIGAEEKGKCVVVFRGDTYLQELTLLRRQSAQIISRSVEGIRVPTDALRIRTKTVENEDGTKTETQTLGVYCMVGMEARFKPVEMLYRGEGFALVKGAAPADAESLWLRPGDEIIISARDLYDGKVIS